MDWKNYEKQIFGLTILTLIFLSKKILTLILFNIKFLRVHKSI